MKAIGYVRVSTDRQAEAGVSLGAQAGKIRAMALLQDSDLVDMIIEGESAKNLNRPGMQKLLGMVNGREVEAVIVAKLDRLTRSVKDLCELLELFERRGVALVSVAEALDTGSAAGRLVITIMGAVSQWEREAIRGADARCAATQAEPGRAGGEHRVRDAAERGRTPPGSQPGGASCPGGDRPTPGRGRDIARDRREPEPAGVPDAPGHGLAPGVRGSGAQGGRVGQ